MIHKYEKNKIQKKKKMLFDETRKLIQLRLKVLRLMHILKNNIQGRIYKL